MRPLLFNIQFQIMSEKNTEEEESIAPPLMSRIAFPKAKYGLFASIIIIILVLILMYKDYII